MLNQRKFLDFLLLFKNSFQSYGIEIGLFFTSFILWVLDRNEIFDASFLFLFPILITVVYCLNMLFQKSPYRFIYYASYWLILVLVIFKDFTQWYQSAEYFISIALLCPLAILLCRGKRKNKEFADELLSYIYAAILSLALCAIIFALVSGINLSLLYILGFDTNKNTEMLTEYSVAAIFLVLCPLIFFSFLSYFFSEEKKTGKILEILINYVFTPALLLYSCILYLYFFRILFLWELPKGGIAYMVFAFTILAFMVKFMRNFLKKTWANLFFEYFSFFALPALCMFWVGLVRRITEFGFTEARVYLFVCGLMMSIFVIAFLKKSWSRYFYLFSILFCVGLCMVCIPYLSAKKIALSTQFATAYRLSESFELNVKEYRRLLSAIEYLEQYDPKSLKTLKIKNREELLNNLAPDIKSHIEQSDERDEYVYLSDHSGDFKMDIASNFYQIRIPAYSLKNDSLTVFLDKHNSYTLALFDIIKSQNNADKMSVSDLKRLAPHILIYENDTMLIKFNSIQLRLKAEKMEFVSVELDFVLIKNR